MQDLYHGGLVLSSLAIKSTDPKVPTTRLAGFLVVGPLQQLSRLARSKWFLFLPLTQHLWGGGGGGLFHGSGRKGTKSKVVPERTKLSLGIFAWRQLARGSQRRRAPQGRGAAPETRLAGSAQKQTPSHGPNMWIP